MKMVIVTILVIFALCSVPASASLFGELDIAVTEYNMNLDRVPSSLENIIGNEDMLLKINTNAGGMLAIRVVTEDLVIIMFKEVDPDDLDFEPTLIISVDEATLDDLRNSDDVLADLTEANKDGDITMSSPSILKNVGITVGKFALKVSNTLGLV